MKGRKLIKKESNIDSVVFWPAILVSLTVLVLIINNPQQSKKITDSILGYLTGDLGWIYGVSCIACLIFSLYLIFGKLGSVKLGAEDDEPEFSYFSWVAMIFAAAIGIGLMLFGFLEPIMYLSDPPFGVAAHSNEAFEWAHAYGQFHWGISAWAFYVPITVIIAYYVHAKKKDTVKLEDVCKYSLKKKSKSRWMSIVDVLVAFSALGGIGAALGLAIPLISNIACDLFGIPNNWYLKIAIVLIWVGIFGVSVFRGLDKGIKIFSNINIVIAVAFVVYVFCIGPGNFIMKMEVNSIGLCVQNFTRMSFWTDPIANTGFTNRWTYFYWGWWLSYTPMIGLFVARVSKGRTIKEVAIAMMVWGTLGCCLFFAVFGGYSLYLEKNNILNVTQILNTYGREVAIVSILKTMPFSKIVLFIYGIICFIFLATTIDSAAYVVASVCTKKLTGDEEPQRWNRLLWAFMFGAMAISLVMMGGMEVIQASAIIGGTPIIFVYLILTMSFRNMLQEDKVILNRRRIRLAKPKSTHSSHKVRNSKVAVNPMVRNDIEEPASSHTKSI